MTPTLFIVVVSFAGLCAALSAIGAPRLYDEIGGGDLALDTPFEGPDEDPETDMRQLLGAISDVRTSAGYREIDIEADAADLLEVSPRDD
jgi:hypothetical protein